jgi:F0F1-type ATP synthase assembly protein I
MKINWGIIIGLIIGYSFIFILRMIKKKSGIPESDERIKHIVYTSSHYTLIIMTLVGVGYSLFSSIQKYDSVSINLIWIYFLITIFIWTIVFEILKRR